ncbi:MAG: hypothetical protein FWH26_07460, partial [Oscillospiraceae bacterium]|nr:hypothetical protein [Oscillospiraceae bacterium]
MRRLYPMPRPRYHVFRPGPRFRRRKVPPRLLFALGAIILIAALLFPVLEKRASPQVRALAENAAKQQAATAVVEAVESVLLEERVNYERLVTFSAAEGAIRSIQTNTLEINLIRGKINAAVEEAVTLRHTKLRIPLGALTGSELFTGRGPHISVPLTMTGHALSTVRSDLSSSGLNQTMHRILLDLRVSLSVILPGGVSTQE